jgi:hypothetical protein
MLKSWVLDIKNEALNLRIGEETQQNWWSATFDKVPAPPISRQGCSNMGVT